MHRLEISPYSTAITINNNTKKSNKLSYGEHEKTDRFFGARKIPSIGTSVKLALDRIELTLNPLHCLAFHQIPFVAVEVEKYNDPAIRFVTRLFGKLDTP